MQIGTQVPEPDIEKVKKFCVNLHKINIHHIELGPEISSTFSFKQATSLSRFLAEHGIKVYSVHAPFGEEADLSCPREEKRKKAIISHKQTIEKMQDSESPILVVHPGEKVEEKNLECRIHLFHKSLEELLFFAEKNNVILALENMVPGFVGGSSRQLRQTIKQFDSPYLGICFDTGHSYIGGMLKQDFDSLKNWIVTFHVHDNDGLRDLHLQPPYGTIPWQGFISWVENLAFQHPLILESFPWGKVEFEWVKKEIELLFEGKIYQNPSLPGPIRCASCGHFLFKENEEPVCYCSTKKRRAASNIET